MKKKDSTSSPKRVAKKASASPAAKAPRKRAAKKAAAPAAAPFSPRLDYPQEGERVSSQEYALRIDAPQEGMIVEVSIDGGAWAACRTAVGYWWYDWAGFGPGEHSIQARAVAATGDQAVSEERRCLVEL